MINYNMNRVLSALAALLPAGFAPQSRAYANRRPTGAALRNPSCPFQAERIAKAQAKRERRATKRACHLAASVAGNYAHKDTLFLALPARLDPFYVNRGAKA